MNHGELNRGYVRIVSDLRQNFLSVGCHLDIGFITNFITNLVDEVEWDGDGNVVVGKIKRPFAVFG